MSGHLEPTFTTPGGDIETCTICEEIVQWKNEIPAYTALVMGRQVILYDDICMDFYLNLDSRIQGEDTTISVKVAGDTQTYHLNQLDVVEGIYVVSVNLVAVQMTENIELQVAYGQLLSPVMSYTLRSYAEYILIDSEGVYDAATKTLVKRMLNYGAAAQNYFLYNTGNLANKGYEMTDIPQIPEADAGSVTSGDVRGVEYYGASLLYETRVGVRFYFTVTGRIENYTFTDAKGKTYEPVLKSGRYYVEVMDINPNAYNDAVQMNVSDGTNTLTVDYSPMRYISRKFYSSADQELVALVASMYHYYVATVEYLKNNR